MFDYLSSEFDVKREQFVGFPTHQMLARNVMNSPGAYFSSVFFPEPALNGAGLMEQQYHLARNVSFSGKTEDILIANLIEQGLLYKHHKNNGPESGETLPFSLDVSFKMIPRTPGDINYYADFGSNVQTAIYIGFGMLISSIILYRLVLQEKESRVLDILRQCGLLESAWISSTCSLYFLISITGSLVCCLTATIFENKFYTSSDFFLFFFATTGFMFSSGIFFLSLAPIVSESSSHIVSFIVAIYTIFLSSIVLSLFIFSGSVSAMYRNTPILLILYWVNPWVMYTAYGFKALTFSFNNGTHYTFGSFTTSIEYCFVLIPFATGIFYMGLCWYFSNMYVGLGRRFWFLFDPVFWGMKDRVRSEIMGDRIGIKQRISKERQSIQVHKLSKSYDAIQAVKEFTLEIPSKKTTVLLGHNGAGKTTLIKMLSGNEIPTHGYAFLLGYDLYSDFNQIQKFLSICPQENLLWEELTATEHLEIICAFKGIPRDETERVIRDILTKFNFGYISSVENSVGNFSGGMKRTLQLAIASVGNPKILILDEPTTGMDPIKMRYTWGVIQQLKQQCVVLITTHNMEEADALGDNIAIMAEGRLKALGEPLFLKNRYGATTITSLIDPDKQKLLEKDITTILPNGATLSFAGKSFTIELRRHGSSAHDIIELLKYVENSKIIEEWKLNNGTLEEVFLRLVEFTKDINSSDPTEDMTDAEEGYCHSCNTYLAEPFTIFTANDIPITIKGHLCKNCQSNISLEPHNREKYEQYLLTQEQENKEKVEETKIIYVEDEKDTDGEADPNQVDLLASARRAFKLAEETNHEPTLQDKIRAIVISELYIESTNKKTLCCYVIFYVVLIFTMFLASGLVPKWKIAHKCGNGWTPSASLTCEQNLELLTAEYMIPGQPLNMLVCPEPLVNDTCPVTEIFYPDYWQVSFSNYWAGNLSGDAPRIFYKDANAPNSIKLNDPSLNFPLSVPYLVHYRDQSEVLKQNDWDSIGDLIYSNEEYVANNSQTFEEYTTPCWDNLQESWNRYGAYELSGYVSEDALSLFNESFPDLGVDINTFEISESQISLDYDLQLYYIADYDSEFTLLETQMYLPIEYDCLTIGISMNARKQRTGLIVMNNQFTNTLITAANSNPSSPASFDIDVITPVHSFPSTPRFQYIFLNNAFVANALLLTLFRLPGHVSRLVNERKSNNLFLLEMHGVSKLVYYLSSWVYSTATDFIMGELFFFFAFLSNIEPARSMFGYLTMAILVWAHCQSCLAIFLSAFFTSSQSSSIICYVFIILNAGLSTIRWGYLEIPRYMSPATWLVPFLGYNEALIMIGNNFPKFLPMVFLNMILGSVILFALGVGIVTLNPFDNFPDNLIQLIYSCFVSPVAPKKLEEELPLLNEELPTESIDVDVAAELKEIEEKDSDYALRVVHLVKDYVVSGGTSLKRAVNDVSFGIKHGSIFGLLGPNGAGKSTTLSMLSGFHEPTQGFMEVNGYDMSVDRDKGEKSLAICTQDDIVWDNLSVEQHLLLFARLSGVDKDLEVAMVQAIAEMIELDGDPFQMLAGTLSGGQRKRLSIGISLMSNPKVWLLDEPSTGLDPGTRTGIWKIITIQKQLGRAVVLTTHSMEEADSLSDRIGIMSHGRLQAVGSRQHLKERHGHGNLINLRILDGYMSEPFIDFLEEKFQKYAEEFNWKIETGFTVGYKSQIILPSNIPGSFVYETLRTLNLKKLYKIKEWSFSHCELSDVFIRIVNKADEKYGGL